MKKGVGTGTHFLAQGYSRFLTNTPKSGAVHEPGAAARMGLSGLQNEKRLYGRPWTHINFAPSSIITTLERIHSGDHRNTTPTSLED